VIILGAEVWEFTPCFPVSVSWWRWAQRFIFFYFTYGPAGAAEYTFAN